MSCINFLEGEYLDEAPYIDTTFHGYLAGLSLSGGRVTPIGYFALRAGATIWIEHRGDSGWKEPEIMPVVNIFYSSRRQGTGPEE
ncbi:MAG: hypothetical protein JXR86_16470 [Spirochaetales bacterium]|nr:hypothetical protein [Spirochaetales bacterium]